jgi:hypothetical protein
LPIIIIVAIIILSGLGYGLETPVELIALILILQVIVGGITASLGMSARARVKRKLRIIQV